MGESQQVDFYLKDGRSVANIEELIGIISESPDELFYAHVNEEKNDFYNWINEALKEAELARRIRDIKKKEAFLAIVKTWQGEKRPKAQSIVKEIHKQVKKIVEPVMKKPPEKPHPKPGPEKPVEKKPVHSNVPTLVSPVKPFEVGVPGFDQLIDRGVPSGSSILLAGGPGSGKTTFGLQTLRHGVEKGEQCLYLTFEEGVENLMRHLADYGWDPSDAVKKGNLLIKKVDPFDLSRSVEALLAKASGELLIDLDEIEGIIPKGTKPTRIVLDSLSAVAAAFAGRPEGYRIYVQQLFNLFQKTGATSFLITEAEQSTEHVRKSGIEEFLADMVISFYNIRKENERVSALEIIKIRGTGFQKRIVPFKIVTGKGLVVYPLEEVL